VAEGLLDAGYVAENQETTDCVKRWSGVSPEEIRGGRSADYLRRSGQEQDLEFVLRHIDDVRTVPILVDGELIAATRRAPAAAPVAKVALGGGR
jgi:hypothetical protein